MSTVKPLNTIPLQQFIDRVKGADASKAPEVKLPIADAKALALTLGSIMSRLHGDLEKLVYEKNNTEEVINVTVDGGSTDWK